jgi:hypothetical protein
VLRGAGNNGEDGFEGVASGNIFGTYLHGSLLPKNPHLADLLIARALRRRSQDAPTLPSPASAGGKALRALDDGVEMAAHQAVVRKLLGAA